MHAVEIDIHVCHPTSHNPSSHPPLTRPGTTHYGTLNNTFPLIPLRVFLEIASVYVHHSSLAQNSRGHLVQLAIHCMALQQCAVNCCVELFHSTWCSACMFLPVLHTSVSCRQHKWYLPCAHTHIYLSDGYLE